ncbi:MAG: hypothetical protein OQK82_03390 [Candidatus Pacearchaeota archaeon]|nr:hypothetical protein [Candidatus Pacearchaeota archaeon]
MSKSIIAGIITSIQTFLMFLFLFIILNAFSPISTTPESQAVLESGQQALNNTFSWWLIADSIGGIIVIFGIIYAVIKVAKNEVSYNLGTSSYY